MNEQTGIIPANAIRVAVRRRQPKRMESQSVDIPDSGESLLKWKWVDRPTPSGTGGVTIMFPGGSYVRGSDENGRRLDTPAHPAIAGGGHQMARLANGNDD